MKIMFKERMTGKVREENHEVPAEFNVSAISNFNLNQINAGKIDFTLEGRLDFHLPVEVDPSATNLPLRGFLTIDVLRRKLIYRFQFGHRKEFWFEGEKNVRIGGIRQFLKTMTHLSGTVYNTETNLKHPAIFHFDLRKDLLPMLKSFRIRF